ncbi:ABC transporter permease [Clostridium thermarum]|uniref:ABC transporter permease n=1 Tax=Clostridium thermarum TaxID=1716543 RepID=UPI0011228590|nr:ABC transporter permease [Clostridium thermarum]
MLYSLVNLIKKDLKLIVRHRGAVIASLCLPFLLYGIFAFVFSDMMEREADITPMKVAVVDKEKSTLSRMLISNFKDNTSFSKMVKMEIMEYPEAEKTFERNELTGIIVIPEGFSRSLIYLENYPIEVILNKREPLKSSVLKNMMESYGVYVSSVEKSIMAFIDYLEDYDFTQDQLIDINEKMSIDLIFTALSRGNLFEQKELDNIPSAASTEYFISAILVLILMYSGVTSGNYLIKELNSGCYKRTLVSSTGPLRIIISKWISFSFFGILQALIFILPLAVAGKVLHTDLILRMVLYMSISILFIASIFIFLAAFFQREEAFIAAGNISVFICALAGGSFLPLQLMPAEIQKLASVTPNYWIIKGSMYIVNYYPSSSIKEILLSFSAIGLLLLGIASVRLRKVVRG